MASLIGAEALVRWNHPVHGLLAPEVFIGIAEESGLIHRLGRMVLERACAFAMSTGLPKVSVNVSPLQLRSEQFAQIVIDVLAATGLPAERLELDLTERIALDPVGSTSATLKRLRAAGVSIALDDFATGDSTFQYMREYSIGMLKIDRSFVQRLGTDPELDRLVQAVLDLARTMGIEVTADGVETAGPAGHPDRDGMPELPGVSDGQTDGRGRDGGDGGRTTPEACSGSSDFASDARQPAWPNRFSLAGAPRRATLRPARTRPIGSGLNIPTT